MLFQSAFRSCDFCQVTPVNWSKPKCVTTVRHQISLQLNPDQSVQPIWEEQRMPFRAIVSGPVVMVVLPRRGPRCKKLPEFVGVSRSGEADKQANNCAGKVCRMELENWVQTSHSKPGSHPIQGKRVDRWSWSLRRSQRNSWNRSLWRSNQICSRECSFSFSMRLARNVCWEDNFVLSFDASGKHFKYSVTKAQNSGEANRRQN